MSDAALEFDVVVVGGGPAGLAAACLAAECGRATLLVDETPWLGGQIWRGAASAAPRQAREWLARFERSGAKLLERTSVIAAPTPGFLLAQREEQPVQIGWHNLVLATGGRELFLPFPGWTLPGVLGAGGLQSLVKNGWPVEGQRVVLAGSGPLLLAVADGLRKHGARVLAVFEQAPWRRVLKFGFGLWRHFDKLTQGVQIKRRLLGVPYRCGTWPTRAEGGARLRRVSFTNGRDTWSLDCDLLACGFGLVPNVELAQTLGCQLREGFVQVDSFQLSTVPEVYCAGEPTGIGGADCALVEGQIAGYAAAGSKDKAQALWPRRAAWHRFRKALDRAFALRPELRTLAKDDTIFCRCEDVACGRVRAFSSWRAAKLQTRCGMGACQGRVCGAAARALFGWSVESIRPPILPARVGSLVAPSGPAAGTS